MNVGKSGLVYIAFMTNDGTYTLEGTDLCIQAYKMYEIGPPFSLTITVVVIIASSVIIIGAGIGILRGKRKKL